MAKIQSKKHKYEHKHDPKHKHSHGENHCEENTCAIGEPNIELDCGCASEHEHGSSKKAFALVLAGTILFALSFLPFLLKFQAILLIIAVFITGHMIFYESLKALFKLKFDETLMLTIAVAACFALGDFVEAAAVTLFFSLGQAFEAHASERSRKFISSIASIRPDKAYVDENGKLIEKRAEEIAIGTEITVMPYERVPINGKIIKGSSSLDVSALTGESLPLDVSEGDEVLSGSINGNTMLILQTTEVFENSAATRILKMVEEAAARKGKSERMITSFAKYYTPIVIAIGFLIGIVPSLITGEWSVWVNRGLIFLVASCPCALVLSVPLSFFAGIGAAAKQGILVKGGMYVEALSKAKIAVFDKTGTLTLNEFEVKDIKSYNGFSKDEVLEYAALAEYYSDHPIAISIVKAAGSVDVKDIENYEEFAGGGVKINFKGKEIICGGKRFMSEHNIDLKNAEDAPVFVAAGGRLLGSIRLGSKMRNDAKTTIKALKKLGFKKTVMLTGDNKDEALEVAKLANIDEVYYELLPEDKLNHLKRLKKDGDGIVYIGDGINDAPVLALADVGVAMGLGAEAAAEAADMVLADSNLSALVRARKLFAKTVKTVRVNIVFALIVKFAVLFFGALGKAPIWDSLFADVTSFGKAPIWLAVFADVGVMIITVLNASLLLRSSSKTKSKQ